MNAKCGIVLYMRVRTSHRIDVLDCHLPRLKTKSSEGWRPLTANAKLDFVPPKLKFRLSLSLYVAGAVGVRIMWLLMSEYVSWGLPWTMVLSGRTSVPSTTPTPSRILWQPTYELPIVATYFDRLPECNDHIFPQTKCVKCSDLLNAILT